MARIVFPSNPSENDTFEAANGRTWIWTGTRWKAQPGAAPQTFADVVTIQKELVVTTADTTYPGVTVDRGTGEDRVYMF